MNNYYCKNFMKIGDIVEIIGCSRYYNGPSAGYGTIIDIDIKIELDLDINDLYEGSTVRKCYFVTPLGKDPKIDWFGYSEGNIRIPLRLQKLERILCQN